MSDLTSEQYSQKTREQHELYSSHSTDDLLEELTVILAILVERDMICPSSSLQFGLAIAKEMDIHAAAHKMEKN